MEIALKIIAGVGAFVVLLSLLLVKVFSLLVNKGIIRFSAAPQPTSIHLEQDPDVRWQDEFDRDKARTKLSAYGLTDLGYFTIYEMKGVILNAFISPDKGLVVLLYEHPGAEQWVDFAVQFQDGGSFTISSAKGKPEPGNRPNHDKIHCPGASIEALYEKYQTETPAKNVLQMGNSPELFTKFFEEAYKEEMAWRNGKDNSTTEKTLPAHDPAE